MSFYGAKVANYLHNMNFSITVMLHLLIMLKLETTSIRAMMYHILNMLGNYHG